MKTKLTKKQQRENNEKALLRDELFLLAQGAADGRLSEFDDMGLCAEMGLEAFQRYLRAVRILYEETGDEGNSCIFGVNDIDEFDTPEEGAELLWRFGVRAGRNKLA